MNIKVINPKNKTIVKRAVEWLKKHNEFDNQRNIADGNGDEKLVSKLDKKCESSYDKFLDLIEQLPKNQQKIIYNSPLY